MKTPGKKKTVVSLDYLAEIVPVTKSPPGNGKGFIVPGDGDPRHGTLNGYSNLFCRCPECKKASRDHRLARLASRSSFESLG